MDTVLSSLQLWPTVGMAAAIFAAAILRAFTGFGFALAALPVLSMFLEPTTNVSLVAMLTFLVSLPTIKSYWGHIELKPIMTMLILSAFGTLGGVYILALISADMFQLLIGVTVMGACVVLAFYKPKETSVPGGPKAWLTGLASGLMNGAIAIPGPPAIIYALAVFPDPVKSRAFLMTFFLFSAVFAIVGFTAEGFIQLRELILLTLALPAMVAGDKVGFWLFEHYGKAAYRNVGLIALFVVGVTAVIGPFI